MRFYEGCCLRAAMSLRVSLLESFPTLSMRILQPTHKKL